MLHGGGEVLNITLYDIGNRGYLVPSILLGGYKCVDLCSNFTSLTVQNVSFGVTHWSNYSIGEYLDEINSCGTISFANSVYILAGNITTTGTCFNITANNVTIDGNGFSIIGDNRTGYGVYSAGYKNITIMNMSISRFSTGIYFNNVINSDIDSVNILYNNNGTYS